MTQNAPQPTYRAERRMEGTHLAYYMTAANAHFWDEHWKSYLSPAVYQAADMGVLDPYEAVFTEYLPKTGKVIEAGCGIAQYVLALYKRGYDVEGVDFSIETVNAVRSLRPEIPIRVGDVCHLDVPDHYYTGYISLGVMEHRYEGPEPFLTEAHRVLCPGGIALISVPQMHSLRKLKSSIGLYRGELHELSFYQYAYDVGEFSTILERYGFNVVDKISFSGRKGVKDEIPFVQDLLQKQNFIGRILDKWLSSSHFIEHHFGHMMMFVGQRSA